MGLRLRLKQMLRIAQHQLEDGWQRCAAPWQVRGDQRRLRAIQALQRVEELVLPQTMQQGFERLVLFSHFHPRGWLQRCIRRELADLRRRGWPILLLSDQLEAESLAWCRDQEIGLLRRRNEGRDFGAFQDGWFMLQQRGLWSGCRQLVLLNDSVYPVVNLEASSWPCFLQGDPEAVLGFTDSFQNGYHLQSYGLHLPGSVLQQPWWDAYWRHYSGWGRMRVAIRDGEIGLSQLLLQQGIPLRALHPVSRLRARIASAQLLEQLHRYCSPPAALWIQQQLLRTGTSSFNFHSPAHYWAIPLLLEGCPFIKRWLLESNEQQMLDPLLVAGGDSGLVDAEELADFLRPPIVGFAG
jgi:hypothetical protein